MLAVVVAFIPMATSIIFLVSYGLSMELDEDVDESFSVSCEYAALPSDSRRRSMTHRCSLTYLCRWPCAELASQSEVGIEGQVFPQLLPPPHEPAGWGTRAE